MGFSELQSAAFKTRAGIDIARDPDALYAAALGAIHVSPEIKALFSPLAHDVFTMAYGAASQMGGEAISELGSAVLSEAGALIGQETLTAVSGIASNVASMIGEAMPIISMAVNMFFTAYSIGAENKAMQRQANAQVCHDFLNPVIGSGEGGALEPADLFAPLPSIWALPAPNRKFQWYRPASALGACLVAITEDTEINFGPSGPTAAQGYPPGSGNDFNLLHTPLALDATLKGAFIIASTQTLDPNAIFARSQTFGINAKRRAVYNSLRMAIGSHSKQDRGGHALFALYLDMLDQDLQAGHFSGMGTPTFEWAFYLLTHWADNFSTGAVHVADPEASVADGSIALVPCSVTTFATFAQQIGSMIQSWHQQKETMPSDARGIVPFLHYMDRPSEGASYEQNRAAILKTHMTPASKYNLVRLMQDRIDRGHAAAKARADYQNKLKGK
jgi:hypothetical protein